MTPEQRIRIMSVLLTVILAACIYFSTNMNEHLQGTQTSHQGDIKKYDCVITINVHEKFDFLLKQLQNIRENVTCKYCIVINCNEAMYAECAQRIDELMSHVHVNDIAFQKRTHHGSLFRGIYQNMVYALGAIDFEYFIVASSRNMFANQLSLSDLLQLRLVLDKEHVNKIETANVDAYKTYTSWHWPNFFQSELATKCIEDGTAMYSSPHEGLCFSRKACAAIVEYLEARPSMRDDLFEFNGCVEEFALQTIAVAQGESFYYIGNGCCTNGPIPANDPGSFVKRFMYKVERLIT